MKKIKVTYRITFNQYDLQLIMIRSYRDEVASAQVQESPLFSDLFRDLCNETQGRGEAVKPLFLRTNRDSPNRSPPNETPCLWGCHLVFS